MSSEPLTVAPPLESASTSSLGVPLALWVVPNTCDCGQKWTHSYITHLMGGTPLDEQILKGTIHRIVETLPRHHRHCHRCISLFSGIGWSKPGHYLDASVGGPTSDPPRTSPLLDYTPRRRPSSRSIAHKRATLTEAELEALEATVLKDKP